MPQTSSQSISLGTTAADFSLPDGSGQTMSLQDFAGAQGLLVAFISNRCPFVAHIKGSLAELARSYAGAGLRVVAINSNDAEAYPEEARSELSAFAAEAGFEFPYLKDADQTVAIAYGAACTPDLYLFDAGQRLAYHGQFDGTRPKSGAAATGEDLRAAIEAVLSGSTPSTEQAAGLGCNIKWRAGNEPAWFSAPAKSVAA